MYKVMYSPSSRFEEIKKKGRKTGRKGGREEEKGSVRERKRKGGRRDINGGRRREGAQERQLTASWFDLTACAWCFSTSVQKSVGSWP